MEVNRNSIWLCLLSIYSVAVDKPPRLCEWPSPDLRDACRSHGFDFVMEPAELLLWLLRGAADGSGEEPGYTVPCQPRLYQNYIHLSS